MAKYQAKNLEDIAQLFAEYAQQCRLRSNRETTQRDKSATRREAVTWDSAADMLRNTELKGE